MIKKIIIGALMFFLPVCDYASSQHLGQHFIFSLPETRDKESLKAWLTATRPGGVMLLASHFTNKNELKDFMKFLREESRVLGLPHLFVTVDWEGGIVSRPNKIGNFVSVPSPWALANAGRSACFLGGMLIGKQLRDYDIDIDFAPSLDLFDPSNEILATRCFAQDPKTTAQSGIAFSNGLMSQGIIPVIKHFPGLGVGKKDTHLATVSLGLSETELEHHMQPFLDALEAGIPMIMSTHAQHNFFGPNPITLEARAVQLLKKKSKNALIITDDFSMKGVHVKTSVAAAGLQALCAGYDMIIFSGKPDEQIAMLEDLHMATKFLSAGQKKILLATGRHVDDCKKRHLFTSRRKQAMPVDEAYLSSFLAKRCFQIPVHEKSLSSVKNVCLFSTNLPIIRPPEKWFVTDGVSYLGACLEKKGKIVREHILDPKNYASVQKIEQACGELDDNEKLVVQTFFYADNVWNAVQLEWLKALKPYQDRLIVISLGHPLEQMILPNACVINLGSFGDVLLDNVTNYLCDEPELTGAEHLARNPMRYLRGKKIGLLCHKCSVIRGARGSKFLPDCIVDWVQNDKNGTELVALFSPEHGLLGTRPDSAHIDSSHSSAWGCPVYSLHGTSRKPTPEMLSGIDLILIDFQEVGTRCYTYLSTMSLVLEAAAEAGIKVIVLDRPNPLSMWKDAGPFLEKAHASFLGKVPTKFLHGSTIGGIAQKINTTIGADLTVLDCCSERTMQRKKSGHLVSRHSKNFFFHRNFIPPSPNLGSLDAIFAYPLTVFLEGTNYSEGRGTAYPFLQIGAPWVNKDRLARALNSKKLPGLYFEAIHFIPHKIKGVAELPKHDALSCGGVFVHIYNHLAVQPMTAAQTILQTLFTLYPKESKWLSFSKKFTTDLLAGTDTWRTKINAYKESLPV